MVKPKKIFLFSPEEVKQIENKIRELEKKTSGEIVVQVLPAAGPYLFSRFLFGLMGLLAVSFGVLYLEFRADWALHFQAIFPIQILALLAALCLFALPPIERCLIPKKTRQKQTMDRAYSLFTQLGIHQTRNRTGILVLLFALERQVVILADSGIHAKVKETYWKEEAHSIAIGFKEKKAAESLVQSLERMSQHLATHFPVAPKDSNELSDEVRF